LNCSKAGWITRSSYSQTVSGSSSKPHFLKKGGNTPCLYACSDWNVGTL